MAFRVLVVEDDSDIRKLLRSELEDAETDICSVVECQAFAEATAHLDECNFDGVVLDLVEGDPGAANADRGNDILERLRSRRFLPVVFYTGYPDRVRPGDRRFVRVISKQDDDASAVRTELISLMKSELVRVAALLEAAVTDILRRYYWEALADAPEGTSVTDREIVHSTVRRVAWELSGERAARVVAEATGEGGIKPGTVFPSQAFLWPPVDPPGGLRFWTGDLVKVSAAEGPEALAVVLTPACDLVAGKAPWVLLIGAIDVASAKKERGSPEADIRGNKVFQYYWLPAAYGIPELCLDFGRTFHRAFDDLGKLNRVATLDEPWVHEVRARFQNYVGRVGTPNYAS